MSSTVPISPASAPRGDVQGAIARAAQATGVDFDYLLAQARIESGLNPRARAGTSSATGLYQFTGGTWLATLRRHGAEHGLDPAAVQDPAARAQIMALRHDPELSSLMAGELANDNRDALTAVLGRAPDHAELYLAHFLGAGDAGRFLTALASDPSQSAAALLPKAAGANRAIFFAGGAPRSVGEVMALLRGRFSAALEAGGANGLDAGAYPYGQDGDDALFSGALSLAAARPVVPGGPIAQEFHAAAASTGAGADLPRRASMAETLRDAFALNEGTAAPEHVRAAYGRLRMLGI